MSTKIMPLPDVSIAVRPAAIGDLPFIDSLQKMHTKMVGWMPTKQLEGKIAAGHVMVAEEVGGMQKAVGGEEGIALPTAYCLPPTLLGYCIGHDQYFKRDDVGIIYQMNVAPGRQRGLIGATLLKAQFEKSAWGCKLYCCWCAQDIGANRFWEAMGFAPLAFRTGSAARGKNGGARTHIFWQRRIRQGDVTTPYWFPSQTTAGAIREDRLVLPIPRGVHWSDGMPRVLPGAESGKSEILNPKQIGSTKPQTKRKAKPTENVMGGLFFASHAPVQNKIEKAPKPERVKVKNDPKLVAAARELRDRWLEEVNAGRYLPGETAGKYDVGRVITGNVSLPLKQIAA